MTGTDATRTLGIDDSMPTSGMWSLMVPDEVADEPGERGLLIQ